MGAPNPTDYCKRGVLFEDVISESAKEHLLRYTIFLLKNGYCDSDVIDELPTAIDRYLEIVRKK